MIQECRQKLKGVDEFYITNLKLKKSLSVQLDHFDVVVTDLLSFCFLRVTSWEMFDHKMGIVVFLNLFKIIGRK